MSQTSEKNDSLWILAISPLIWTTHLLLSYITVAMTCGRMGSGDSPEGFQISIAVYTVLALVGISITGWQGLRRHRFGSATVPHDFDTPEDRHRFLGFATLLLSVLSAVGTVYVAMAVALIGRCY